MLNGLRVHRISPVVKEKVYEGNDLPNLYDLYDITHTQLAVHCSFVLLGCV